MSIFSFRQTLSAAVILGACALMPQIASASCLAHPSLDTGRYVNTDPNTRSITTVDLRFICGSLHRDNGDGTATIIHGGDPHWSVRLYGSCSPSDCDWGQTRGDEARGRSSLVAAYDQGFASRNVSVFPNGREILVVVQSTYTDGRAPRRSVNWMRPE